MEYKVIRFYAHDPHDVYQYTIDWYDDSHVCVETLVGVPGPFDTWPELVVDTFYMKRQPNSLTKDLPSA
jgi:hypothetical protein